MRIRRRSDRRVFLTRRIGIALLLGLLTAVIPVLHAEPVSAASGVDDYPARLKAARLDGLVDPWQFYNRECTSWVAWRLNSENRRRVHRLLAGRPLGQRLELAQRRPVAEHPGRRQSDPRRRRLVVRRLGRLVAWTRRLGSDGERRRDHDRGVQLPPRRLLRHPHDLPLQLDVAERLHPHQGHRRPQHRGAHRQRHAAGRHEGHDHERQVERDQPRLPLPVARQR